MIERIEELRAQAQREIEGATSSEAVEQLRVRYLGRKAELPQMLRSVATLAPEQRGAVGKAANEARQALEQSIEVRAAMLDASELDERLAADTVDVTLPGTPAQPVGRLHVLSATMRELEDIFLGLGFNVRRSAVGDAGGLAPGTGSSDADGGSRLGAPGDLVLRTHTSPMQIRAMEAHPPPLYVVIPGRVYRPDSDATHTPQFHQVEGLAVDEDITLADLKGTLLAFAK